MPDSAKDPLPLIETITKLRASDGSEEFKTRVLQSLFQFSEHLSERIRSLLVATNAPELQQRPD